MEQSVEVVKEQSVTGWKGDKSNINLAGAPPKTHWWSQLYIDELERESKKMAGLKKREVIVQAVVDKAQEGDMVAVKEIGDRVQGKVAPAEPLLDPSRTVKGFNLTVVYE